MEEEDCSNCVCRFNFADSGFKFQPTEQQICEYYLPMMIQNRKLTCNHVIAKVKMYEPCSTPWDLFKDDDPHWLFTTSETLNNNNKNKKSVMYAFTRLKRQGKKRFHRKAGCGTWNQQYEDPVFNGDGQVIGSNRYLNFLVMEQHKEKIGEKWHMHEYTLKPLIEEYAICKITKELEIEEISDNNIPDYNQLPVIQVEDHQFLDDNTFGLPVVGSVPHQDCGGAYTRMLLQPEGGGRGGDSSNMNPEPPLVVNAQDPNQFSSENIFSSTPVDIVPYQDYGEWNVYANMLSQPAGGGMSSNIVSDQPQADDMGESLYLKSVVNRLLNKNLNQLESDGLLLPNTSKDLVNVAAANPNQLQQGNNTLPQSQSLSKRKNSEDSTVTKERKKQRYIVFN